MTDQPQYQVRRISRSSSGRSWREVNGSVPQSNGRIPSSITEDASGRAPHLRVQRRAPSEDASDFMCKVSVLL